MFELQKKIAVGSAVEAYLAQSTKGTHLVQVSRPELRAATTEVFEAFLSRARHLATRQHPALLTPSEFSLGDDGRFTLVSPPLSGATAADRLLARGALPSPEVQRLILRVIDALEFLHQQGVVHGCLSPDHLYLEGSSEVPDVKLFDTALLLFRGPSSLPGVIGNELVPAEYLSPQRIEGHRATAPSDIYGLGVLAFELLTGAPPFRASSPAATRAAHLHGALPVLSPVLNGWRSFFAGTLCADPKQRLSLNGLRNALLAAQEVSHPVLAAASSAAPAIPTPAVTLELGARLGPYRLEAKLGEGGMGSVFRASHQTLGRTVALKVLHAELSKSHAMVQRFIIEAQAVCRIRHPHIVEIFDLVNEPGGPMYFVMELLEGQSLRDAGKKEPLSLARVVRLMRQVAEALAAAHGEGVIHRDIKPDNLFLVDDECQGERAKVLDFGVARVAALASSSTERVTQDGQTVGTPLWMAPEQLIAGEIDPRVDVYSLATVMYVLLTQQFPFQGGSSKDVVVQRLSQPAKALPSVSYLGEQVPSNVSDLLARCLAQNAKARPVMAVMAQELSAIEQSLMEEPVPLEQPTRPSVEVLLVMLAGMLAGAILLTLLW